MDTPVSDIYFFHITKTAGVSLGTMLRSLYAPENRLSCGAHSREEQAILCYHWHELPRIPRAELDRFRCFTGHYGTALYSMLDRDVPTVTLLRDPFERSISHINYAQTVIKSHIDKLHGNGLLKRLPIWERMSPSQFLWLCDNTDLSFDQDGQASSKDFVNYFLRDTQTRFLGIDIDLRQIAQDAGGKMLSGYYEMLLGQVQAKSPDGWNMEATLERAKRRLDTMAVVGTVERFTESAELIFDYLGVPMPETLRQENISRGHKVGRRYRDTASPRLTKRIDSVTEYDRVLYDYANQLLDQQLERRAAACLKSI